MLLHTEPFPPELMKGGLCFWFEYTVGSYCIMINSYSYNENAIEQKFRQNETVERDQYIFTIPLLLFLFTPFILC